MGLLIITHLAMAIAAQNNRPIIAIVIGNVVQLQAAPIEFAALPAPRRIAAQLQAISKAMMIFYKNPSAVLAELTPQIRTEFSAILQLSRKLSWGDPAFCKSPIGRFARAIDTDQIVQAQCVMVWSLFRKMGTIIEPKEIFEIASNLELKSANFRSIL